MTRKIIVASVKDRIKIIRRGKVFNWKTLLVSGFGFGFWIQDSDIINHFSFVFGH